jgi:hypothetical protein
VHGEAARVDRAQPPADHAFVTTTKPEAAAAARIGAALAARKRGELLAPLKSCFVRPEPWFQAGKYIGALVSDLPKRNGWAIAQQAGDRAPQRTQRLLNRACWDTFAAMGVVRRFAVAGLEEAARSGGRRRGLRIGAIDETSQVKQGTLMRVCLANGVSGILVSRSRRPGTGRRR